MKPWTHLILVWVILAWHLPSMSLTAGHLRREVGVEKATCGPRTLPRESRRYAVLSAVLSAVTSSSHFPFVSGEGMGDPQLLFPLWLSYSLSFL